MKSIVGQIIVGSLVAFIAGALFFTYVAKNDMQPTYVAAENTDAATHFLGMCTGLDVSDEAVRLIGMANCLGRVRGFVDGYQMASAMHQPSSIPALWCVDADVTDKEVMDTVFTWADQHPKEYKEITDKYEGLNAAIAVTIRAIHEQYSCGTT